MRQKDVFAHVDVMHLFWFHSGADQSKTLRENMYKNMGK